ncbi:hypothetical protein AVEN_213965-1 [Araneus ventricosus]|uniref:Uncharacterized protein n=1 Tax=Araneus ventricosus TaxID=182803 RepID=A0A4Y2MV17_ARAVE|nr:hypothetical protein AVEN_213965-1 [Araneus ventricosus]
MSHNITLLHSPATITLKQAIHISSKMEFLEHGEEKAIVSFKNRWKLAQRNGKAGIQTNSKSNTSCVDTNLWPRCEGSGTSKDLSRLGPRDEARKSKIRRVWGGGTGEIEERWLEPP